MKILFTGGGTGGHFYPIIAVANAVRDRARERKILDPQLYYMAPDRYNPRAIFDAELDFVRVPAGKIRRYFSLANLTDAFKTAYGCIVALLRMYTIFPDVVFGKGGYASFPALLAAKLLGIPVIIHESDSKPGRVNAWAGKFATKIAVSYPSAASYFKKAKPDAVAYTGNPIRKEIMFPLSNGAEDYLQLEPGVQTVVVLGGSQGAATINDTIIAALPELLENFQVIHQTGRANLGEIRKMTSVVLKDHPHASRYHAYDYMNELALRMAAGVAKVIVSRAGSTIFEIAVWGVPSIIIPLPTSVSHDQTTNAFAYAQTGAASVIEQNNLTPHVLIGEITRIATTPAIQATMRERAKTFARSDAATIIADALLDIALSHEK